MDIQNTRGCWAQSGRSFAVATSVALAAGLSACGGGGGTDAVALPTLITAKSCTNISGGLDTLQTTLTGQLRTAVLTLPTVGAPAAAATTALSQTLDTVDAVSNALTTLARTQNPQQFTAQLTGAGDSILCAGSSLSNSLSLLSSVQGAPVPGLVTVQQTLALVSQRVADGLVGSVPGADLKGLTNQLVTLSQQVAALSSNLPTQVSQPYLKEVLALNATAFNSLALILDDLGALNGAKLSTDVTALLLAGATSLQGPLAAQLGIPTTVLSPVTSQFIAASQTLNNSLTAVASPTLQAVSAVLGGASLTPVGSAASAFSDLIDSALSSTSAGSPTARVTQLTQQLGGTGGLSLGTALLQSFGGLLPGAR